jgi:hypothetical protein
VILYLIGILAGGMIMNQGRRREARGESLRSVGYRFGGSIAAGSFLVAALTIAALPGGVRGAEKSPEAAAKEGKIAKKKADADRQERIKKRLARQAARAKEAEKDKKPEQVVLPPRPARSVTPPTLTSAELDSLIRKHLKANDPKVAPAPRTSDVEFVRRIYFDLMGQPPTASQMHSFVRDDSKEKRARLIDHLLTSSEFAANWARYWRDVVKFHATGPVGGRGAYPVLEAWLTEKFKKNAPWDEIAAGLITAAGRTDENGAVGLALAHEARPVELAGEVSRIFMGIQIQCAQCHDHKTDSWKQRQFHEFAAFFQGGRQKRFEKAEPGKPAVFGVTVQGKPRYTYTKADDPKKPIPVAPKFFLASTAPKSLSESGSAARPMVDEPLPANLDAESRRLMAASYVTGQDNPWFAKAFVNRTWYALMGEAFYMPIDDIGPEREVEAPEILEPLASQWQRGGYDVRWLFRTILNTEAYQRRVRSTASMAGRTAFASNCPSRLRSDQIFLALSQALGFPAEAGDNADSRAARMARRAQAQDKESGKAIPIQKTAAAKKEGKGRRGATPLIQFNNLFGADPSAENEDVLGTIPQALYMMNSPVINQRTQARPGTVLGEILKSTPNDRAALGALYVRVLSRQPTRQEVETCAHYMGSVGNRAEAFEDVYWCLINSTEFITRR